MIRQPLSYQWGFVIGGIIEHQNDLAAAGTLSTERVRERLAKLHVQRHALTQRLNGAEDHIREESDMMQNYLDLLEKPGEIYDVADDSIKRKLLAAYFTNIWMDDDGHKIVPHAQKQPVVAKMQAGSSTNSSNRRSTENRLGASELLAKPPNFDDIFLTKMNVVPQAGFEPAAYRLEGGCSIH